MTDDDLNAPLGQFPVQKGPSRGKARYAAVAIGVLGLLAVPAAFFAGASQVARRVASGRKRIPAAEHGASRNSRRDTQ